MKNWKCGRNMSPVAWLLQSTVRLLIFYANAHSTTYPFGLDKLDIRIDHYNTWVTCLSQKLSCCVYLLTWCREKQTHTYSSTCKHTGKQPKWKENWKKFTKKTDTQKTDTQKTKQNGIVGCWLFTKRLNYSVCCFKFIPLL